MHKNCISQEIEKHLHCKFFCYNHRFYDLHFICHHELCLTRKSHNNPYFNMGRPLLIAKQFLKCHPKTISLHQTFTPNN